MEINNFEFIGELPEEQIPDKEKFCRDIATLRKCVKFDDEVRELARKYGIDFCETGVSTLAYLVAEYMERVFGCYEGIGDGGDISFFCFEEDFGEDWRSGDVTDVDEDGNVVDIDFSTSEKLYDYLINRMENGYEE